VAVDAGLLALAALLAWGIAHRVLVRPVLTLTGAMQKIAAEKNYAGRVPETSRDEMGRLGRSLNELLAVIEAGQSALEAANRALHRQADQIAEATNVLGSAATEIVASTTQLTGAASETAASVTQTSTTVAEVRQTAELSNQKARSVAESAQNAAQVSQTGRAATEEALGGMKRIRQQMDSIADSMVRLSEQTQAISQIISTVDDLAAQSNILAVNAAIEAAKAGEQGKGFAVVAREVKNLAEQSKQATNQVRAILHDIQRATSAAVMATEQGAKVVEAGAAQSTQAGDALLSMTGSVTEAARAASQILASHQQQFIGIEQVASAMESIKQSTAQNLASARQLETSARHLGDLGHKLRELTEHYKTGVAS
jgi:methyl-accepting chemotaxis protein